MDHAFERFFFPSGCLQTPANITSAGAVHMCGLNSKIPEEISMIILAFRQLEKELAEAVGPLRSWLY